MRMYTYSMLRSGHSMAGANDFTEEDVVAAYIVGHNFSRVKILSVSHASMCAGGIDFYLADVDFLGCQVLYYYDSGAECACASSLSIFTTDCDTRRNSTQTP